MTGKYDLVLYRGDSYTRRVRLWEDDLKTDPVDLTGATVAAEFRDKSGGTNVVALDCTITLPNIIDVSITPDMWVGAPTSGAWDLEVTYASGAVITYLAGKVTVTPDVTNSTVVRAAR